MNRPAPPSTPDPHLASPAVGKRVDVWMTPTDSVPDDLLAAYPALLSAEETRRWRRFRFARDRRLFLIAHALLRTSLSRYGSLAPPAWEFEAGQNGKPEIGGPPGAPRLAFNLTHTTGLAAVAVAVDLATVAVGLDAEWQERDPGADIARRHFAAAEVEALEAFPSSQRKRAFLAFWTLKEAYVKARGTGLSLPLDGFAFQLDPLRVHFEPQLSDDPARWQFLRRELPSGHALALAIETGDGPDRAVRWRETVPLAATEPGPDEQE